MFLHTWITRESWQLKATLGLRVCIRRYLSLISWCSISSHFTVTTKGSFWNKLLAVVRVCSLVVVNFYRRLWKKKALVTIIISLKLKVQSISRVTIPPRGGHLLGIYQVVYSWDRSSAAGVLFLSQSLFFYLSCTSCASLTYSLPDTFMVLSHAFHPLRSVALCFQRAAGIMCI